MATTSTIVGVTTGVHTSSTAILLTGWAAYSAHTCISRPTGMTTISTIARIIIEVYTNAGASRTAGSIYTRFTLFTFIPTISTVVRIALEARTGTTTASQTRRTLTDPIHTGLISRTDTTTTSTIVQIGLEVGTGTIAVGLTRGTKDFGERDSHTGPGQQGQHSSCKNYYQIPSLVVWLGRQNPVIGIGLHTS